MSTLQAELRRLGLAKQVESNSQFDDLVKKYPVNRMDKPVAWAKWLVRRKLPANYNTRCCLCGWFGDKRALKKRAYTKNIQGELLGCGFKQVDRLSVCGKCHTFRSVD